MVIIFASSFSPLCSYIWIHHIIQKLLNDDHIYIRYEIRAECLDRTDVRGTSQRYHYKDATKIVWGGSFLKNSSGHIFEMTHNSQ